MLTSGSTSLTGTVTVRRLVRWITDSIRERSASSSTLMPGMAGDACERRGGRLERGVDRLGVDLGRDLGDEVVDRVVRVSRLGRDGQVDLAACRIAPDAPRQAALLALVESLVDHAVHVGADLELLGAELVLDPVVGHRDLAAQRRDELVVDRLAGFVGVHPADVDTADRDPLGDLTRAG